LRTARPRSAYVANEGKLVAFIAAEAAEMLLAVMRAHKLGRESAIIGHVVQDEHRFVQMATSFGGERIVDWLSGEQLRAFVEGKGNESVRRRPHRR